MIALLIAAGVAFAFNIVLTPFLIRALKARGIGQLIRDDGPFAHPHAAKAGTPTMGGLAIVGGVVLGYAVAHVRTEQLKFARTGLLLVALIIGLAVVGFLDDYLGVKAGRNLGLRKRGKMAGLLVVSGVFAYLALDWVDVTTKISFTRPTGPDLTMIGWFILAVLVVTASSNGVNLTDGMDGLAAGSATLVFMAFTIICFWQFRHFDVYMIEPAAAVDLAVVSAALAGACGGFLWWNAAPAQIFMGDTGSLAIGGAMAGLALLSATILLLPILGGLYVVETLSVIAQVVSFRGFHRRVLRMAPIQHLFEVGGLPGVRGRGGVWYFACSCVWRTGGVHYV